jgi:hypothetical protein
MHGSRRCFEIMRCKRVFLPVEPWRGRHFFSIINPDGK